MKRLSSVLAMLAAAGTALAQEYRGSILGRVIDPSGAAAANVSIEAVNIDTGVKIGSTSNDAGNYQIPFLVPGNYTVRVEQAGFKRIERPGIRVATKTPVTLDSRSNSEPPPRRLRSTRRPRFSIRPAPTSAR